METDHKGSQKIRQFPHFWSDEFDVSTKPRKTPHPQGGFDSRKTGIPTKRAVLMSESSSMRGE